MSTRIAVHGSEVRAVYDDRFIQLLEALGTPVIERASEVEFDPETREWVATHKATGQIIGRSKSRAEVIAQEVRFLESIL